MELILWRHADAEDHAVGGDAARRLTKRGRKQAERMADWLRSRVGTEWRIVVSPARRALETVKPLERPFEVCESVGTDATAASLLEEAGWPDGERPVMVVGHQPTLGEVAAQLMGTAEETHIRKCAVWWFASRDPDAGRETVLRVVIDPELLEASE